MNIKRFRPAGWIAGTVALAALTVIQTGCQTKPAALTPVSRSTAGSTADEIEVPVTATARPQVGQALFTSDGAAAAALLSAVKQQDHARLHQIFGPAIKTLVSGDKVEDHRHFEAFVAHARQKFWVEQQNANVAIVHIGKKNWPFPIPIVRMANGKWFFDSAAGMQEILERRIGCNELEAIRVCHAYVIAQREYFSGVPHASGMPRYASRFISKPGTHDGLYWPVAKGQPASPLGPLVAQATAAGYTRGKHKGPRPFYGYYFHILKRQGSAAPGGALRYGVNGRLIAGFALVAFPAKYGSSGIMTFIVNQDGLVYQRDLGPNSSSLGWKITTYNPTSSWSLVRP